MRGERECAIGWSQTKARTGWSAIDRSEAAQLGEQGQHGHADNREVIALDTLEQLDSGAFDLIGAHALQSLLPNPGEVAPDKGRVEGTHRQARRFNMTPDRLAVAGKPHGTVEFVRSARDRKQ